MVDNFAVVFDLDGLLLDSEPLWRRAEQEVFGAIGVSLTEDDCAQTTGLRLDAVVAHWHARHHWSGPSHEIIAERIVDRMVALIEAEAEPMPGALGAVERVAARRVPIALATSSPRRLITPALRRLGIEAAFRVASSADAHRFGKPHPAVYLDACDALGVDPLHAVAIEDSLHGVIAAKAARMRCVAVPAPEHRGDSRFAIADARIDGLDALDLDAIAAWFCSARTRS